MKSNAAENEQNEEKEPAGNLDAINKADADSLSAEINQNTCTAKASGEQTSTPEEKLPEEPLSDQDRHLLYEKGIK